MRKAIRQRGITRKLRILLLLVIALEVNGQCYCEPDHCKVRYEVITQTACLPDTVCFELCDYSGVTPDSVLIDFGDSTPIIRVFSDTICHVYPTYRYTYWTHVYVYESVSDSPNQRMWQGFLPIGLVDTPCGCVNASDCNDNNLCTWDECYQGQCRHQKACRNCNAVEEANHRRLCCCR